MRRTSSVLLLLGALAFSVSGCALLPAATTPSAQPSSSAGAEPETTPTVAPSAPAGAVAFDIACTRLLSDQVIYEWGSGNWAVDPDFSVDSGSSAEEIVDYGGTACGWVNLTSGEKLTVAIGQFEPALLAELRADRAASATAVTDFAADGFFEVSGQTGQADAFSDPYWVSASSGWFGAASDAALIVQTALDATS